MIERLLRAIFVLADGAVVTVGPVPQRNITHISAGLLTTVGIGGATVQALAKIGGGGERYF